MTKIIGLTGGIGSGKSTIAAYFKKRGIPVYIADEEAKKLMNTPEVIKKVQTVFDENIIENNQLNRKKIAELVFSSPEQLKKLNSIVHPEVRKHFTDWVEKYKDRPFVIKEAAILFESGTFKDCDKIILVTAPEDVKIDRVMKRDKVSKGQVLERMKNQWSDEKKIPLSDYVIQNIDLETAIKKTEEILKELNKM
ncbi:dephospho-CoA kinase [Flavobacterium suncheonense]|uniref:Dephospho-CoA kinase n=1 Tax=Flavobacterium suncheonense GH29-5 = DSM 17707 TaxID=1121899 RepID=A0A0A2MDM5_9FLAO|nr:dephospho-CoA kinase [Flavobacterium suncheonense]KGO90772.1 dephospho-CoA kinase [Flavobacterium suncheonense GH29-5 = DSM 17707]